MDYFNNVLKSLKFAGKDAFTDLNSNAVDVVRDNKEFVKNSYNSIKDAKKTNLKDNEIYKNGRDLVKNALSDLKSGKFYNEGRKQKAISESFKEMGFDMDSLDLDFDKDMDFDKEEDFSEVESDDGNLFQTKKTNNIFINNGDSQTPKAVEQSTKILGSIYTNAIEQTSLGFSKVNASLNKVVDFQNTKTIDFYNDVSSKLTDIGNILRNNNATSSSMPSFNQDSINNYLFGTSALSLEYYAEFLKKKMNSSNYKETASLFKPLVKEVIANPLGLIMKETMKAVIPQATKDAMEGFNQILEDIPLALQFKFKQWGNSDNPAKKLLGGLFDDNINKKAKFNFGEFNKKNNVKFNARTERAITNVIPSLLSKILASVSKNDVYKQELVYDYDRGKFTSADKIKENFKKEQDDAFPSYYFDDFRKSAVSRLDKNTSKKELAKINKEITKAYKQMASKGQMMHGNMDLSTISSNPLVAKAIYDSFMQSSSKDKFKFHKALGLGISGMNSAVNGINENSSFHNAFDVDLKDLKKKKTKNNEKEELASLLTHLGVPENSSIVKSLLNNKGIKKEYNKLNRKGKVEGSYDFVSDKLAEIFFGKEKMNSSSNNSPIVENVAKQASESFTRSMEQNILGTTSSNAAKSNSNVLSNGSSNNISKVKSNAKNGSFIQKMFATMFIQGSNFIDGFKLKVNNFVDGIGNKLFGVKDSNGNVIEGKEGIFTKPINDIKSIVGSYSQFIKDNYKQWKDAASQYFKSIPKKASGYFKGNKGKNGKYDGGVFSNFLNFYNDKKSKRLSKYGNKLLGKKNDDGDVTEIGIVGLMQSYIIEGASTVKTYLFGKRDKEGKITEEGILGNFSQGLKDTSTKIREYFLGKGSNAVKNSKFYKQSTTFVNTVSNTIKGALFGEKNVESGKYEGGLIPTMFGGLGKLRDTINRSLFGSNLDGNGKEKGIIRNSLDFLGEKIFQPLKKTILKDKKSITKFFSEQVKEPLKGVMNTFLDEFKYKVLKAYKGVKNFVNDIFTHAVGKPLTQIMDEKIITPFKNILTKTKDGIAKFLGKGISKLVMAIRGHADVLKGKQSARQGDTIWDKISSNRSKRNSSNISSNRKNNVKVSSSKKEESDSSFKTKIKNMGSTFEATTANILHRTEKNLNDYTPKMKESVEFIKEKSRSMVENICEIKESILDGASNIGSKFSNNSKGKLGRRTLYEDVNVIKDKVILIEQHTSVLPSIQETLNDFINLYANVNADKIPKRMTSVETSGFKGNGGFWSKIKNLGGQAKNKALGFLGKFNPMNLIRKAKNGILGFLTNVKTTILDIKNEFVGMMKDIGTGLLNTIKEVNSLIINTLPQLLSFTKDTIQMIGTGMYKVTKEFGSFIYNEGKKALSKIYDIGTELIGGIKNIGKNIISGVGGLFGWSFNKASGKIDGLKDKKDKRKMHVVIDEGYLTGIRNPVPVYKVDVNKNSFLGIQQGFQSEDMARKSEKDKRNEAFDKKKSIFSQRIEDFKKKLGAFTGGILSDLWNKSKEWFLKTSAGKVMSKGKDAVVKGFTKSKVGGYIAKKWGGTTGEKMFNSYQKFNAQQVYVVGGHLDSVSGGSGGSLMDAIDTAKDAKDLLSGKGGQKMLSAPNAAKKGGRLSRLGGKIAGSKWGKKFVGSRIGGKAIGMASRGKGLLGKAGKVGSKVGGKLAGKFGLKTIGRVASLGSKLSPLGIAMGAYDGLSGFARAGESFGTDRPTFGQRVSGGLGSLASGLSLGILNKDKLSRGVYKVGSTVGNGAKKLLGFGGREKKKTKAMLKNERNSLIKEKSHMMASVFSVGPFGKFYNKKEKRFGSTMNKIIHPLKTLKKIFSGGLFQGFLKGGIGAFFKHLFGKGGDEGGTSGGGGSTGSINGGPNSGLASDAVIEYIKSKEGFYPNLYNDSGGVPTIGYGSTHGWIMNKSSVTKEEATKALKEEVDQTAKEIKADLDKKGVQLSQHEFDALVSFGYNVGTGGLFKSSLYKNIVSGNKSNVKDDFGKYTHDAAGNRLNGLVKRREEEASIFLSGSASGYTGGSSSSSSSSSGGGASSGTADKIISTAKTALGVAYQWGGNSMSSGVDCSGLTQQSYKAAGINIPRVAADQLNQAPTKISNQSDLQPSDLVFFKTKNGSATNPGHVGIYLGGGKYIHAPKTGDVVKISEMNGRGDFVGGGRYIGGGVSGNFSGGSSGGSKKGWFGRMWDKLFGKKKNGGGSGKNPKGNFSSFDPSSFANGNHTTFSTGNYLEDINSGYSSREIDMGGDIRFLKSRDDLSKNSGYNPTPIGGTKITSASYRVNRDNVNTNSNANYARMNRIVQTAKASNNPTNVMLSDIAGILDDIRNNTKESAEKDMSVNINTKKTNGNNDSVINRTNDSNPNVFTGEKGKSNNILITGDIEKIAQGN